MHQATMLEKSRDVLIDVLLLARCGFGFGIPSNVLIAALIMNPWCDFKCFDFALDRHQGMNLFK